MLDVQQVPQGAPPAYTAARDRVRQAEEQSDRRQHGQPGRTCAAEAAENLRCVASNKADGCVSFSECAYCLHMRYQRVYGPGDMCPLPTCVTESEGSSRMMALDAEYDGTATTAPPLTPLAAT